MGTYRFRNIEDIFNAHRLYINHIDDGTRLDKGGKEQDGQPRAVCKCQAEMYIKKHERDIRTAAGRTSLRIYGGCLIGPRGYRAIPRTLEFVMVSLDVTRADAHQCTTGGGVAGAVSCRSVRQEMAKICE